jgi:polysaccharide biosynthesis protein PslG
VKRSANFLFLSIILELSLELLTITAACAQAIPALPVLPIPQNIGVNIHFHSDGQLSTQIATLQQLGIGWVRRDLPWKEIETSKGVYNFSGYDTLINALHNAGLRIVMILDYNNALYDNGNSPQSAQGRAAFAHFAQAAAQRYAGKVTVWEIYNEPNNVFWSPAPNVNQYIALANETTAAIHSVLPGAIVVGPALAGPLLHDEPLLPKTYGYLNQVLASSTAVHGWSAITVHPYRTPSQTPETVITNLNMVRSLMTNHGIDPAKVPLIAGEWGYSTFSQGVDEQTQAAYAVRSFLMAGIENMPYTIWYDWQDDGASSTNNEYRFGLLRYGTPATGTFNSNSIKPSFTAVQQFISLLRGYSFNNLLENDTIMVARYIKGSQYAYVAWTTDNAAHAASISLPVGQWTAHQILGAMSNHTAVAGQSLLFTAQKMPLVIVGSTR